LEAEMPVFVVFVWEIGVIGVIRRQYEFMLKGLQEVEDAPAKKKETRMGILELNGTLKEFMIALGRKGKFLEKSDK
jgi:hypothetical protein